MEIIPVEFQPLACPHCRQHGVDSRFTPRVENNTVMGYSCPKCRSFWDCSGNLTQAPKQSKLRKLLGANASTDQSTKVGVRDEV